MMVPATIDIDEFPALRRMAEEVRETRSPIKLRVEAREVALLLPAPPPEDPSDDQGDDQAFFSSLGGWKSLVDGDRHKEEFAADRGSRQLAVGLWRISGRA